MLTASERGITHTVPEKVVRQEMNIAFEGLALRKDSTATLADDSLEPTKLSSLYSLDTENELGLKITAQHIYGYGYRKYIK